MPYEDNKKYTTALTEARKLSKLWRRTSMGWQVLAHAFVVGASTASFAVVYVSATSEKAAGAIILLSLVSALLTLMGVACNPTEYMRNYRAAFQILNAALIKHTDERGNIISDERGYQAIQQAIIMGERHIGKTYALDPFEKSDFLELLEMNETQDNVRKGKSSGT